MNNEHSNGSHAGSGTAGGPGPRPRDGAGVTSASKAALVSPVVVKQLLASFGLAPLARLGQHFLTDANVLNLILAALAPELTDTVLEVGPGLGTVTRAVAPRVEAVTAVEVDRGLVRVLEHTVGDLAQVTIVAGDALRLDLSGLVAGASGTVKAVSNLPYYITSPLLFRLLEAAPFERLVLMVQQEVAQRLVARPGSAAYGALSVTVGFRCRVEVLRTVSRNCFYPVPGVDSSLVLLQPRPADSLLPGLEAVVKAAFGQRRKTLATALAGSLAAVDRAAAMQALQLARLDPRRRGETLSVAEFAALAAALKALFGPDWHADTPRN